jgi:hypothetical protein
MVKFALSLYALNASPEEPTWQICDAYGPFESDEEAVSFLNRIDPKGRLIKNVLIVEGKTISRECGKFVARTPPLTANQ